MSSRAPESRNPPEFSGAGAAFVTMIVALVVALACAGMLVASSLDSVHLPGCGPQSACAQAAASAWGRVPGLNWPVSFVGFAFYLGLLIAVGAARGRISPGLRWIARIGALVTIGFIALALTERLLCPYCFGAHLAYLCFAVAQEFAARKTRLPSAVAARGFGVALGVFVIATVALIPLRAQAIAKAAAIAERELAASTEKIAAAARPDAADSMDTMSDGAIGGPRATADGPTDEALTASNATEELEAAAAPWGETEFTGRYRQGPAMAAIRIVILSDYQCPDCKKIELDVRAVLAERDDVSFSAKHFPMCTECNSHLTRDMHPNACQAARAAEAAGTLGGEAAFWEVHHWLFDVGGIFTARTLRAKLNELALDYDEFLRVMQSDETLALVQADIEEGVALGLHFTPMVFINGVELRGWQAPNALRRAVQAVGHANPPASTAASDRPPLAAEKYIEDWRQQPKLSMRQTGKRGRGPADAAVEVVVFGDYQEANTRRVDAIIAEAAKTSPIRYYFRHYPFDSDCNPNVQTTQFPMSCAAAKAVEAAGVVGGDGAFWEMHDACMKAETPFDEDQFRRMAAELGFDAAAMATETNSATVADAITTDVTLGKRFGVRAIPTIFIDGRRVPRWLRDGTPVLREIIAEARP